MVNQAKHYINILYLQIFLISMVSISLKYLTFSRLFNDIDIYCASFPGVVNIKIRKKSQENVTYFGLGLYKF